MALPEADAALLGVAAPLPLTEPVPQAEGEGAAVKEGVGAPLPLPQALGEGVANADALGTREALGVAQGVGVRADVGEPLASALGLGLCEPLPLPLPPGVPLPLAHWLGVKKGLALGVGLALAGSVPLALREGVGLLEEQAVLEGGGLAVAVPPPPQRLPGLPLPLGLPLALRAAEGLLEALLLAQKVGEVEAQRLSVPLAVVLRVARALAVPVPLPVLVALGGVPVRLGLPERVAPHRDCEAGAEGERLGEAVSLPLARGEGERLAVKEGEGEAEAEARPLALPVPVARPLRLRVGLMVLLHPVAATLPVTLWVARALALPGSVPLALRVGHWLGEAVAVGRGPLGVGEAEKDWEVLALGVTLQVPPRHSPPPLPSALLLAPPLVLARGEAEKEGVALGVRLALVLAVVVPL